MRVALRVGVENRLTGVLDAVMDAVAVRVSVAGTVGDGDAVGVTVHGGL